MSDPAPSVALNAMADTLTALATAAYQHDDRLGQHLAVTAALLAVHATRVAQAEAEAMATAAGMAGLRARLRQQDVTLQSLYAEMAAEAEFPQIDAAAEIAAMEMRRQQRVRLARAFPGLIPPDEQPTMDGNPK
jgi:hypothetical protein